MAKKHSTPEYRTTAKKVPQKREKSAPLEKPWLKKGVFKPFHQTKVVQHEKAPRVILEGQWLTQVGFNIGSNVKIKVAPKFLLLYVDDDGEKEYREE